MYEIIIKNVIVFATAVSWLFCQMGVPQSCCHINNLNFNIFIKADFKKFEMANN